MKTYIQETIKRLRELDRYASPAPWQVGETESGGHAILCEYVASVEVVIDTLWEGEPMDDSSPDLEIITEARNALPTLLAEIDRLTAEIDRLTDENTQLLETAAEVWAEGYLDKEAEAGGVMIHCEPRERAENPYKKDN